jgi:uncharacterized membrane protein YfcA
VDPLIVLFGLGVGILVGLTGMGGGSLMTPLLIVVFGVKPVVAVGSDLTYGAVTKTLGGWRHLRHGTVDMGLSTWICIGSVPAAVGGVYVLHAIEEAAGKNFDDVMLFCLAGALLFTGTAVLIRSLFSTKLVDRERFDPTLRNKVAAVALGAFVGTDVFQAAILLWAAAAAHVVSGNVDWGLVGTILIGSLPGVWIGSHLITKVRVEALRLGLAIVLIGSGLGILTKAGVPIPAPVLAGVPAVLALVLFGQERIARRRGVSVATPPITPSTAPITAPEPKSGSVPSG